MSADQPIVTVSARGDGDLIWALIPEAAPDPENHDEWTYEGESNMTSAPTLGTILDRAGIGTLGVLDAQIEVPVLTGVQAQGDLIFLPRPNRAAATTPIPQHGVEIVRSEAGGNTHSLLSLDGPTCYYDVIPGGGDTGLDLGVLTVPEGATAYGVHTEEHGANAFGPGTYVVRRQREQADQIRMVAD